MTSQVQILVRNIDRNLGEAEIYELFSEFGKLQSCSLVMDAKTGSSKGFGFVDMLNMNEAEQAIRKLNGKRVGANILRVKRAANSTITKHRGKR